MGALNGQLSDCFELGSAPDLIEIVPAHVRVQVASECVGERLQSMQARNPPCQLDLWGC